MKFVFIILFINTLILADKVLLPETKIAEVDGTVIFEYELNREVAKILPRSYVHSNVSEEKLKIVKDKAMDSLIEKTLLHNYAISKNLTVEANEIEVTIKKLSVAYGSKDLLLQRVEKNGFTPKLLKEAITKDLLLKKLYEKEIEFVLTNEDLKKYYEKNKYKFKEPQKVKVRLIYVRNNPLDTEGKTKAKKRILKAKEELRKGENFPFVAQKYSDDPTRVKGGDMGYIHKGRLDRDVEKVAFSMQPNTTSDIIEKDIGYFIVKLEDKKEQNQLSFKVIKEKLKRDLKKKEEDKRKLVLLEKLLSNAVIVR